MNGSPYRRIEEVAQGFRDITSALNHLVIAHDKFKSIGEGRVVSISVAGSDIASYSSMFYDTLFVYELPNRDGQRIVIADYHATERRDDE